MQADEFLHCQTACCPKPVQGGTALQKAATAAIPAAGSTLAPVDAAIRAAAAEHAAPGRWAPTAPIPDEQRLLLHHLQLRRHETSLTGMQSYSRSLCPGMGLYERHSQLRICFLTWDQIFQGTQQVASILGILQAMQELDGGPVPEACKLTGLLKISCQSDQEHEGVTCCPSRVAGPAMAACCAAGSWKSTKAKVSFSFSFERLMLTGCAPRSAPNLTKTSASASVVTLSGRLRTKMLVPGGPSSLAKYLQ